MKPVWARLLTVGNRAWLRDALHPVYCTNTGQISTENYTRVFLSCLVHLTR